jgi:ubiquinone/menaquinone biosynthesis C-methylase UbiE
VKQNIYDNPEFFEGYRTLRAREAGLNAAIEEPAVRSVLPILAGLTVLDLGSGFGDFCRFARRRKAARVVGVDISRKMIAEARRRTRDRGITFIETAIEDFRIGKEEYDLIVSRLALHYVSDYRGVVRSIHRGLRAGGLFVLSVEHPVCTALGRGWHEDSSGNWLFWPVDDYGKEGKRRQRWLVEGVIKYHRTVETYVNTLLRTGFRLVRLLEPQASSAIEKGRADLGAAARRPPLLVIAAAKADKLPSGAGGRGGVKNRAP